MAPPSQRPSQSGVARAAHKKPVSREPHQQRYCRPSKKLMTTICGRHAEDNAHEILRVGFNSRLYNFMSTLKKLTRLLRDIV
jgi:hypothetical protein